MRKIDQTKGKLPGSSNFGSTLGPFVMPQNWAFPAHSSCPTVILIAFISCRPTGALAPAWGQRSCVPGGDGVMASMGMMASVGRMALGAAPAHTRPLTESSDLPSSLEKAPLLQEVKGWMPTKNPAGFPCRIPRAASSSGGTRCLHAR